MDKIEELENKALALVQEIAELKKSLNAGETIEWRPNIDDVFYYPNARFEVETDTWDCSFFCSDLFMYNRIFKTEEECQKYCDYRKALIENSYKFSEVEWNDINVTKYSIDYNYEYCKFSVAYNQFITGIGKIYFKTKDDAQFMIDNYSDEMLKWGLN